MGGVSTAVKNDLKPHAVKVMEGEDDDEMVITRLEHTTPPINIVNVYGEIEGRCKNEEIKGRFDRFKKELDRIRREKEACIIIGDLNKKVGCDNLGVKGNTPQVSYGGKLVRAILESGEYFLANNTPEAVGGPFTREEPADAHLPWERRRKSCLDLVLISTNLKPFYSSLLIDSKRIITPKRVMMKRGKLIEKPTDHYSLVLKLKNLPRSGHQQKKEVRWNLMKPGGWLRYKELSDDKAEAISKVVENRDLTVAEAAARIDKIETKLKFQAFGKSSIKGTQGGGFKENSILREYQDTASSQEQDETQVVRQKSIDTQPSQQRLTERPVGGKDPAVIQPAEEREQNQILSRQSERLEREIQQIKANGIGKCRQIFKIAQAVQGPKKPGPEAHSVVNPETGELVVATKEIQKVFLKHCKGVLELNPVEKGFEEEINLREKLHVIRMKETTGEFIATEEAFERVLDKFRTNNKRNYDFLVRGGEKFKHSMYLLVRRMIEEERFGRTFGDTTLYNIYKGKGKKEDLENMRFIHSKSYLPRTVEAVLVDGMKEEILAGSSCYQIGGQPGHRSQEHLFTVKSVIAKVTEDNKAIVGGVHDIQKFFDKEVLSDVLNTMTEMKVNPKCVRVWGKLNMNTRIRVRCGGGYSPWMDVGDTLGQGSGGAALASQANLDKGITSMFHGSSDLVFYGTVPISPLLFQDDIFSLSGSVNAARSSLYRVNIVMKQKQLKLHKEKTSYILFGNEAQKQDIREKLSKEPLVCGDFYLKEKE